MELQKPGSLTSHYTANLCSTKRSSKEYGSVHKNRSMELERSPDINLNAYGQLVYDKGGNTTQRRKDNLFSKWCWEK